MSKRNPGGLISTTGLREPSATDQSQNSGVWTLDEQYYAEAKGTWANQSGQAYEIGRSLRFRQSASAYLGRTPTVSGNQRTWTYSTWIKRGNFNGAQNIVQAHNAAANRQLYVRFESDNTFEIFNYDSGGGAFLWRVQTTQLFRDPSAWYHLVVAVDTTQATASNRIKMYVNGVQITSFTTANYPSQNYDTWFNTATTHFIGTHVGGGAFFDGHNAEINSIDGQQLDPSYFGYTDYNGVWQPKRYTGAYGTNGFYLPFSENSSPRNLGRNFAGTNLVNYSEDFNSWTKDSATVTVNQVANPLDGATTADLITFGAVGGYQQVYNSAGFTATSNEQLTFSVWLRATGTSVGQTVSILIFTGGAATLKQVTLTSGWQRFHVTHTATGTVSTFSVNIQSRAAGDGVVNGDNAQTLFAWGAHLNRGSFPDEYISSTGAGIINNDWTPNNISTTAGVTYDSMRDSPTNGSTVEDTGLGGQVPGNYPTIDPLEYNQSQITYSNANLSWSQTANPGFGPQSMTKSTFQLPKTGKWVFAITIGASGNNAQFGIARPDYVGNPTRASFGTTIDTTDYATINPTGGVIKNTVEVSTSSSIGVGDEVQCAVDCDIGTVSFYKNGTYVGQATGMLTSTRDYWPMTHGASSSSSGSGSWNFGQRPFAYAAPAGFKCLNTANLPQPTIPEGKDYFNVVTWNGTGSAQIISGVGFQPDFVWAKPRSAADNHMLYDAIRGVQKGLFTNLTSEELTSATTLTAFNSDGFSVATDSGINGSGRTFVAWNWKAGDTTVTNTAGNITSQVRANPTAGFSIVTYTGNGSGSLTGIGHGLGRAPKFYIIKNRGGSTNWFVYHTSLGNTGLSLNTDASAFANDSYFSSHPNSDNIFVSTNSMVNANGNGHIAYCWAEIEGYSKFGSFVGNGSSDGPFIYTGFRPAFIMTKALVGGAFWTIHDTTRDTTNLSQRYVWANRSDAEATTFSKFDILSNGFKSRNANDNVNYNGTNVIYMAFAEHPFKTSRAR